MINAIQCATPCVALLLAGCSSTLHSVESDYLFRTRSFLVEFLPGGRGNPGRDGSCYRVAGVIGPRDGHLVGSGFDATGALGFGRKRVRLIESTDGKHLLIEEDIPNDCWMHKNYILVSVLSAGSFQHCYLMVPEAPHEGISGPGGIPAAPNDPSTMLSLDRGVLTFRYANGTIEQRSLSSIPRIAQPRPPG